MADDLPLTRIAASPGEAEAIRAAVRVQSVMGDSRLAELADAPGLFALLSDPLVHAPIYTLPRPLTEASVAAFIAGHLEERAAGEGLLFVREGEGGQVMGYSDVQVWPQWRAGELGGALHPSLHGKGAGGRGGAASFAWMFGALGLDLICETAALTNVPTQRMLDGLGFRRMGETLSTRPDGTTRASLVWEITRAEWAALHGFG
jgi:RimJ/RimL family protein N-acetyltransferase